MSDRKAYMRAYMKQWRVDNLEKAKANDRKSKYGISNEEYLMYMSAQEGRCAVCYRTLEEAGQIRALSVDHNHASGNIRGLLCRRCNSNIGWFERYREIVLEYLQD
jgi:hypothetical protein